MLTGAVFGRYRAGRRVYDAIKTIISEREAEIKQNGLPESPCILDLLIESRLQDPEFAAVETDDIVGMAFGMWTLSQVFRKNGGGRRDLYSFPLCFLC